jgi:hypothetical protein
MQTWKFGWTVVSLVALGSAVGCGDDDDGSDNPAAGGAPGSGEGGAPGALECSTIRNFVPVVGDDDGPGCEAYAQCMDEGCGELYEPAFGPDWESGDLSGGVCGASVPCLEDCGCEQTCLTGCLAAALPCAAYALQFQSCYEACATESDACQAERAS